MKTLKKETVVRSDIEVVEVHHSQTVRTSLNYQSAEASYGVTLRSPTLSADALAKKAEEFVENHLAKKVPEQFATLKQLTAKG